MHQYIVSLFDILSSSLATLTQLLVQNSQDKSTLASKDLLTEALKLRDSLFKLPYSQLSHTMDDVNDINYSIHWLGVFLLGTQLTYVVTIVFVYLMYDFIVNK